MGNHREIAYALLRVTMGVVFLFYGIGKFLGGLGNFVSGLQGRFAESSLPSALVTPFAYALPFAEVAIGTLLVLGLFNLLALVLAGLLMMTLTFGAVMEPSPPTVADNVMYTLVIFVLFWLAEYNVYSVDRVRGRVSRPA